MPQMAIENDLMSLLKGRLPDIDQVTPLIRAAATDNIAQLKDMLRYANLKEINHTDPLIGNALTWAAHAGHDVCVALLLENGAWPNITSALQGSPLYQSVQYGHTHCVGLLIAAGADPDLILPRSLSPHYEYNHFIGFKNHAKRSTALAYAEQHANQYLQGYIKLDPRFSLPELSLPIESIDPTQLIGWINLWIENPRKYDKAMNIRIANLRDIPLLTELKSKLHATRVLSDFLSWEAYHQESNLKLTLKIDARVEWLQRLQAYQTNHQLAC